MSELIVRAGQWNSFSSSAVESFLASASIFMGLTQKRNDFLKQIHEDIHGSYQLDKYYLESRKILGSLPPHVVLQKMVMRDCNANQKKQLKIWYTELLAMEPMEEVSPLFELMILLPGLSDIINSF